MSEDDRQSIWPKPPRGFPSWGYYLLRRTLALMFCRFALIAGSLIKAVDSYERGAIVEGSLYLGLLLVVLVSPRLYWRYKAWRRRKTTKPGTIHYGDPVVGKPLEKPAERSSTAASRGSGTWVVR